LISLASCASGAQTFTLNDNISNFDRMTSGIEYSNAGAISNATITENNNPGLGAGAIVGASVSVPTGSILVACVIEASGAETITDTAGGTNRGSQNTSPIYYWAEYAGAGSAIQPKFTTSANGGSDYQVFQFIINPIAYTLAATNGAFLMAGANAYQSFQLDASPGSFSTAGQAATLHTLNLPAPVTITASPNDLPPGFAAGTPPGSIGQVGKGQTLLNAVNALLATYNNNIATGMPNTPSFMAALNDAQVAAVEYFMATYWVSADRILATIPIPANNKYAAYIAGVQAQIAARAAAVAAIVATGLPAITQGNQAPQYSVAYPLTQTPDTYWYQLQFQLVNFCMATGIIPASQILLVMTGAQTYPFNYVSNYTFYQNDIDS
jgi:hypothetical protein